MRVIKDQSDSDILKNDLNHIFDFCIENPLKLNPEKCVKMTVTLKSIEKTEYMLNGISIKDVLNQKYVGVIYDSKMSFNPHIDYIIEKSLKKFSLMKFLLRRVRGNIWTNIIYRNISEMNRISQIFLYNF